jgi:hypothetical protein
VGGGRWEGGVSKVAKSLVGAGAGLLLVVGIAICAGSGMAVSGSAPQAAGLLNPGFEDPYYASGACTECSVADGWNVWYTTNWDGEPFIAPPRAEDEDSLYLEGEKAQLVHSDSNRNFDACLYQQVSGLSAGDLISFTVSAKVISSLAPWHWQTRAGIDPYGGTDPRDIQFELHPEYWDPYTAGSGQWQELSVFTRAVSETATLYACAHPVYPVNGQFMVYWDQAAFYSATPTHTYLPLVTRGLYVQPPGMLQNPDLEFDCGVYEGYQSWSEIMKVLVAPYWQPFWNYVPYANEFKIPEYGYPDRAYRIRSGEVSQQYGLSGGGCFEAGIYQVITGTIPGATYEFELWGLGWSSAAGGDDLYSDVQEGLNFKVGIDPTGGSSYDSSHIVWSELYDPYDAWHRFSATVTVPPGSDGQISVWAYSHPAACWIRFNQVFWDTGSLRVVSLP